MKVEDLIKILHEELSEDLLKAAYRKIENKHKTTGHCYVASEAVYHLCGGREKFQSYCGRDSDGGTHWWLVEKETKKIIDPTIDQYLFLNETPPYDNGRACAFLTKEPSKRCQVLIAKIENNIHFKKENHSSYKL